MSEKGFTFIEILLVVAIAAVFSGMAILNFRVNDANRDLNNQALIIVSKLKDMQNAALTGTVAGSGVQSEYRVSFEDNDGSRDSLVVGTIAGFKETKLDSNIDINYYDADYNQVSMRLMTIAFKPPRADVFMRFGGNSYTQNSLIIGLSHSNTSQQRFVEVNRISGRIDIRNER